MTCFYFLFNLRIVNPSSTKPAGNKNKLDLAAVLGNVDWRSDRVISSSIKFIIVDILFFFFIDLNACVFFYLHTRISVKPLCFENTFVYVFRITILCF